ncbi:MAG: hypothetical protein IJT54_03945 [Candidatus Methanomethylophilaceae archaeon]|nr:hypothetical protein [Candidatus Methanomethylophilaceae archaeon]
MATGSYSAADNAANSITAIKEALSAVADNVFKAEAKTNVLTPNPALVRGFQMAKTGQISTITMDGLGDYDKQKGYPNGSVTLGWTDYTLANDRARMFNIDALDIMQEKGMLEASYVLSEFMRQKVIPEIDAVNIAAVAQAVIANQGTVTSGVGHNIEYGYTPAAATFLGKITAALNTIKNETGLETGFTIFINAAYRNILESSTEVTKMKNVSTLSGVDVGIPKINGEPVVYVPSTRMFTKLDLADGYTNGETDGGFAKAASGGKDLVALIVAKDCAQAINAYQMTKIIPASENQSSDGTIIAFRAYFDCIVPTNKRDGCYAIVKDANA